VTAEEVKALHEKNKQRQVKANELINSPQAPYVFAPRRMWSKRKGSSDG